MSSHASEISIIKNKLKDANLPSFDDKTILRFLHARNYNSLKAFNLLKEDIKWRKEMNLDNLNISHVQSQIQTGKFILPNIQDKQGRPIIIFNAKHHNPKHDFLETLQLAVYGFELAIKSMPEGIEELTIIENLDGFTKDNADSRMVKYLIEILQAHYPGRVGIFIAINAPWYYRLLFKVVKPWLSGDLLSKVNIYSNSDALFQYFDKEQILTELGGTYNFNLNDWINLQAQKENVDLKNPKPFQFSPQILAIFSDISIKSLSSSSIKQGWMKKQGGFVKKFNKRYCVLTETIFYYYKDKNASKPEGFVELLGSKISSLKGNIFCITTAVHKQCIFSTSESEYNSWFKILTKIINSLNSDLVDDFNDFSIDNVCLRQSSSHGFNLQDDNVSKLISKDTKELHNVIEMAQSSNGGVTFINDSKDIFLGSELISWLLRSSIAQSEDVAKSLCELLLHEYYIFPNNTPNIFSSQETYIFRNYSKKLCFNINSISQLTKSDPITMIKDNLCFFKDMIENIQDINNINSNSLLSLRRSSEYKIFITGLSEFHNLSLDNLSNEELLVFYILTYQLLYSHSLITLHEELENQNHSKESILNNISYLISNKPISLSDIAFNTKTLLHCDTIPDKFIFSLYSTYYHDKFPYIGDINIDLTTLLDSSTELFIKKTFLYNEELNTIYMPEIVSHHFTFKNTNKQVKYFCSLVNNKEYQQKWNKILKKSPKIQFQQYQHKSLQIIPKPN